MTGWDPGRGFKFREAKTARRSLFGPRGWLRFLWGDTSGVQGQRQRLTKLLVLLIAAALVITLGVLYLGAANKATKKAMKELKKAREEALGKLSSELTDLKLEGATNATGKPGTNEPSKDQDVTRTSPGASAVALAEPVVREAPPASTAPKAKRAPLVQASATKPWTNSLGMKFVVVPDTEVLFSVWTTRVRDFQAFVNATGHDATRGLVTNLLETTSEDASGDWRHPGFEQTPASPVCGINWDDAQAFCRWLTAAEMKDGRLERDLAYRLPSDWEWSVAVGLRPEQDPEPPASDASPINAIYPWGSQWPPPEFSGNFGGDDPSLAGLQPAEGRLAAGMRDRHLHAAPVGSFAPNKYGLFDMAGNVYQWCANSYQVPNVAQVLRGSSWRTVRAADLRSASRRHVFRTVRIWDAGFRCVLGPSRSQPAPVAPVGPERIGSNPGGGSQPASGQWIENSLGTPFVAVPGADVLFAVWPVRVRDFEQFAQESGREAGAGMISLRGGRWKAHGDSWKKPGFQQDPTHPVCGVSWDDAQAFCGWLTQRERASGRIATEQSYRLPTEVEWDAAIGLSTQMAQHLGDPGRSLESRFVRIAWPPAAGTGNLAGEELGTTDWPARAPLIEGYRDAFARTSPVDAFPANPFGLFDMTGNVSQWCANPGEGGAAPNAARHLRGLSWSDHNPAAFLPTASKEAPASLRSAVNGFRCVLTRSKTERTAAPAVPAQR